MIAPFALLPFTPVIPFAPALTVVLVGSMYAANVASSSHDVTLIVTTQLLLQRLLLAMYEIQIDNYYFP